ncbi:MAG: hypothetical protein MJZ06_09565 [Bacteroidaceae bacterium]|nr:hypothetical protein [Bacteroidaceae bacterium]
MAKFLHRAAYIFRSIVGHSDVKWPTFASNTNHSITDMYIAAYPLDTQFEYNSRLLNLGNEKETVPTKDRIDKMTEQEAKALLLKLLGGKS